METIAEQEFALPVQTFEFEGDGAYVEPNEPTADDDDRVTVSLYESQTGPNQLTARRYIDGETDHYNFIVTDDAYKWCAYNGDTAEGIPVDILHAVHHFGYGVENITTLGHWFTMWMESQQALQTFIELFEEIDDPYASTLAEATAEIHDAIVVSLVLTHELSDADFEAFWEDSANRYATNDSVHVANLKEDLWGTAEDLNSPILGPGDTSGEELILGLTFNEYEAEGNDKIAVDIFAPFGVERFSFEKQSDDEAVFTKQGQSDRPSPIAISAMWEHGYSVENEFSISTVDDTIPRVERTLSILSDLQDKPPVAATDDEHPFLKLNGVTRRRAVILFQLLLARREDEEAYREAIETVSDHMGIQDPQEMNMSNLTEALKAATQLMPDRVHDAVREQLLAMELFTEADFDEGLV